MAEAMSCTELHNMAKAFALQNFPEVGRNIWIAPWKQFVCSYVIFTLANGGWMIDIINSNIFTAMCPFLFTTVSWGNLSNYQQLQYVQKREEEKYVYKKNQT